MEIYAIGCCQDVIKIDPSIISSACSDLFDMTTEDLSRMLNDVIVNHARVEILTPSVVNLPDEFTNTSVADTSNFQTYAYLDNRKSAFAKGIYVLIGSPDLSELKPLEKYYLSKNILADGRDLTDIIQNPIKYTEKYLVTNTITAKHTSAIKLKQNTHTEIQPFNGCRIPGCTIS